MAKGTNWYRRLRAWLPGIVAGAVVGGALQYLFKETVKELVFGFVGDWLRAWGAGVTASQTAATVADVIATFLPYAIAFGVVGFVAWYFFRAGQSAAPVLNAGRRLTVSVSAQKIPAESKKLIQQARDFVTSIALKNLDENRFRKALETSPIFLALHPYFNEQFLREVLGRTIIVPPDGSTLPGVAWAFVLEIDRLEKAWSAAPDTDPASPPQFIDERSVDIAGTVNAIMERALRYDFKPPLPADDPFLVRYRDLEDSAHPIWADKETNQLRRDFLQYVGIVGGAREVRESVKETQADRLELESHGRKLIARLTGRPEE